MKLEFHTPESGDWLVIKDGGKTVYSGHGHGDQMWDVLNHLGVSYGTTEHPDEEYEEEYS